ncbi:MAG: TonB-dependent receptor [Prevotella sp.]|nr:TonB-dependent receptor [Bacteroides sp.]MCM1367081.1 TonB-dependent receptor [Prevotella sp.]MCM1437554.1 TonB-dependent receptor [Prevotella sp.]
MKNTGLILLFFCASLALNAANVENGDTTRVLDEVVITETAAKAPVPLLPLDVKVIGPAVIDNSTETNILPILQNHIPGMYVTERGLTGYGVSNGAAGSVNIRGVGGGNKVLFLIDGQPQWAGVFGHSLPDTYVTNDVQRVEVVSGPSSLLYGSGAMGGSINLITRRATHDGFSGSIRAMGGSYGTQKYGVKTGYKHRRWNAFAAASYESSDGNRKDMDYWLANQYVSLGYDFSKHWAAGANVMFTETKADNPGPADLSHPLEMWTKMFRTTTSVFVKNHYNISSGGIQAYYNWGKHKIDDGLKNGQPRDYLFNSKDYNMGITAYQTVKPWVGNNLSAGVDFKHWGGQAWNSQKSDGKESLIIKKHVNEIAGYVMMQQGLWNDCLSLNAGIRLEHSSQFGNEWVPQAGFIFRPLNSNRIKFCYGKGFRSPNIRELYMYGPRNAELQPERMNNFEVEIRHWLLDKRLNIGLALYYINGDNLIQTIMTEGVQKNMNTGKFINKGVELDATYNLNRDWAFTANYSYLHTNTHIMAAPENKLFGEIYYTPGNWQFSVDILSVWGVKTEQTTENYALLNARMAYTLPFSTPLTIFAKGENLTATKYQINYGFPMPRATVMAGAEWKF